LQKYKQLLDIPRLCRALAIPGELAEQFVEANKTKQYTDGLDVVTQSTNQIADILQSYFFICKMTMAKISLLHQI
jgi:5,10-methylenetetrahydrofolate reductase